MLYSILEWTATSFSIFFLWLLIRRNIYCWPFGILSSLLSIALFIHVKLYSEAILYAFYVFFGVYGWISWSKHLTHQENGVLQIERAAFRSTIGISALVFISALGLGYFWQSYTDASFPYMDAQTTLFALFATWLEARRVFEGWYFWIVLNIASAVIYALKGLHIYAVLMVIYTAMSIYGWWNWSRKKGDAYLLPISRTSIREKFIGVGLVIVTMIVTYSVYIYFGTVIETVNYIDIFTSGIFFTAMYYMANKKIENWTLWIFADIITIPLYAYRGLGMLSLQYLIFTILAIQGYISWKKSLNNIP